jgi:hypothetical protein
MLEDELTLRLETPVKLSFDKYPLDMQARAAAFIKMVQGGVDVTKALAVTGLVSAE